MPKLRHRSVWLSLMAPIVAVLVLGTGMGGEATGPDMHPSQGLTPRAATPPAPTAIFDKGLDKGTFDWIKLGAALPTAWVWVEDDTIDGNGVEYWAFHATFEHPSMANDEVNAQINFNHSVNHLSLQEFLSWIEQTYPHVQSQSELAIHKKTVNKLQ